MKNRTDRLSILTVAVEDEPGIVLARQRARRIAELLGFSGQDQTRIATAVSEIARNAYVCAGEAKAEFMVESDRTPQGLVIEVQDKGPGIAQLDDVLAGRYRSTTGMGLGIIGARRLMDRFDIRSEPGRGTTVTMVKTLPPEAPRLRPEDVGAISAKLAKDKPRNAIAELQEQNGELLRTLAELRGRQDELVQVNQELVDTNRGVVALYSEMEEQAEKLRHADRARTEFLSHMSHELRTPLNSIVGLSRILLDRLDGDLTQEQERQVVYIQKAAEDLFTLVNDLLDLSRVESGRVVVQPVDFEVGDLFSTLRGMLRPLVRNDKVQLIFESPGPLPTMHTDDGKVAQILRNFVTNALKFTEQGEVRVSARLDRTGNQVVFGVVDTGIGIRKEDQERIFQEFVQLQSPLQGGHKGAGLGLPLSKGLAELLGGSVSMASVPGQGSAFYAVIPVRFPGSARDEDESGPVQERRAEQERAERERAGPLKEESGALPILLVDDDDRTRYLIRSMLAGSQFQVIEAPDSTTALELALERRPSAVVVDLTMPQVDGFELVSRFAADPELAKTPVAVVTSKELTADEKTRLSHTRCVLGKGDLSREQLVTAVEQMTGVSAYGEPRAKE